MEFTEQLLYFDLTRQEAIMYLTLLEEGELTGYEMAKLTRISRSNIYNGLAGLVEKGAAYIIEENVTKYTPVNIEEFCNNKLYFLQSIKKQLIQQAPNRREEIDGYITIKGEQHIFNKMRIMLENVKDRAYIAVSEEILTKFNKELKELLKREIKLVIITDKDYQLPGAIIYYKQTARNQIRLIVDSAKVLTGEVDNSNFCTCLYSKNQNLVDVFKEMLQNEIKIIQSQ